MSTVKVMKEVVHPGYPNDNWHLALQHAAITFSNGRSVTAYTVRQFTIFWTTSSRPGILVRKRR
jgi:hypothetical protein